MFPTRDEARETVGMFFNRAQYRPAENEFLEVPPEIAKNFTPQVQRLLGYGVAEPGCGFYKYQDPMRVLFGVEDEETVNM
jgi:ectoine hydroxylase-related dioxygenase (phytanoyl-CoA dioxygenase family)